MSFELYLYCIKVLEETLVKTKQKRKACRGRQAFFNSAFFIRRLAVLRQALCSGAAKLPFPVNSREAQKSFIIFITRIQ